MHCRSHEKENSSRGVSESMDKRECAIFARGLVPKNLILA